MTGANRDPRRKLLIDQGKQFRMMSGLSTLPLITLIGATAAVALLGSRVLNEARSTDAEITSLFPLFLALILLILSAGCMVALQAMRYSHRIAGPSFRLLQSLERIKRGNLEFRVELRDGDELQDLAEGINELLDWLEEHPPRGVMSDRLDRDSGGSFVLDEDREEISGSFASVVE